MIVTPLQLIVNPVCTCTLCDHQLSSGMIWIWIQKLLDHLNSRNRQIMHNKEPQALSVQKVTKTYFSQLFSHFPLKNANFRYTNVLSNLP